MSELEKPSLRVRTSISGQGLLHFTGVVHYALTIKIDHVLYLVTIMTIPLVVLGH